MVVFIFIIRNLSHKNNTKTLLKNNINFYYIVFIFVLQKINVFYKLIYTTISSM